MKVPIVFPPLSMKDASDEPLIIEAVMEEYLVRRVYVDQGASVEVMFEHCFENLFPTMRSRLRSTQMDLEARKKQMIESETRKKTNPDEEDTEKVDLTEQTLVNSSYPDQLVTIGGNLSEECKNQLKAMLNKSMDVFVWESSDMIVVGFRYKRFLDAYKGYNQVGVSMVRIGADSGENYTASAIADSIKIRRNLEAYVDDMVIKSNDDKVLIVGIAETFDNLRRINMKLNPKKCSIGVKEGKFPGYMVTSTGIRANPKKTKAIADMQSPRTLREMQSLSGKLAALKRFLSRLVERSLPFFETLKDITKENKDEYRWTENAKKVF
ncbi:hypothetical protein Tco_1432040 [Tanacetum coccineum]